MYTAVILIYPRLQQIPIFSQFYYTQITNAFNTLNMKRCTTTNTKP